MSKLFIEDSSLTAIGNAIRAKTGKTGLLSVPSGMVAAINSISGSSSPSGGTSAVIQPLTITTNGTYAAPSGVDGYSPVIVNVPTTTISPSSDDVKSLVNKTITSYSDDEVGVIRRYLFEGCNDLTSVNIPNATSIEEYAFNQTMGLDSINAPLVEEIGDYAFALGTRYRDTTSDYSFPNVKTIGNRAFNYRNLATADFPLAETINEAAFYNCYSLTNINLPKAIYIGVKAFEQCNGLTYINLPLAQTIDEGAFYNCNGLININASNTITIGKQAFLNCSSLKNANFPLVTDLNREAFYKCSGLTNISFPELTLLNDYVFSECTSLTTVDFPNVTTIYNSIFSNCTNLQSIYMPKVTRTGSNVFSNCTSLSNVDMPLVEWFEGRVFSNCTSLENVCFPKLTFINSNLFDDCSSLKIADFTELTKIDYYYTFRNCVALEALIIRNNTLCTLGGTLAFSNSGIKNGTGYIYVPAALIDEYKTATNWLTFAEQFRALEDYTVDGTTTGALDETKI